MSKEVVFIDVNVGKLPDWYLKDEVGNDAYLEESITSYWKRAIYKDAQIIVSYNYSTELAIVKAYDEEDSLVWERDNHDYGYALSYVLSCIG